MRQVGCSKFLADDVESFEDWLFDNVEIRDSVSIISLKGLLEMKKSLGNV